MTNEQPNNNSEEEKVDFQEIVFKYFTYWKWFVISIVLCLAFAFLYLKRSAPVYSITSSIMIRDDKKGGGTNELAMFENLGLMPGGNNVDNEVEILKSTNLVKSVVKNLKLNTQYLTRRGLRMVELYTESPILVSMSQETLDTLQSTIVLNVVRLKQGPVTVEGEIRSKRLENPEFSFYFDKLPAVFETKVGVITITERPGDKEPLYDKNIKVLISNPVRTAKVYLKNMDVAPTSKTTSVINFSLKEANIRRGEDFLNNLVEAYNRETMEDKNRVAQNTAAFIDVRLDKLNVELGSTERDLESYKRREGITDLKSDAEIFLKENSEYQKQRVEVETQLRMVNYLEQYMKKEGVGKLVPANVGITDPTLLALGQTYNNQLLERDRLLRTSSESNPAVQKISSTTNLLYENILSSINSVYAGLLISKKDLEYQAQKYDSRISNVPTQEREYTERARQQQIKAQLFLLLLQKREENSLALAVTANSAKIIDDALAMSKPISPNKMMIGLIALVLGIALPIGVIFLIDVFNFRLRSRQELEKLTNITILGEIPLGDTSKGVTVVKENKNDMMAEAFRAVRTNLQFVIGAAEHKVIMSTSSMPSEGKTFISINLAMSLALTNKKVLLLGLDVRKPMLANNIEGLDAKRGASNFLAGLTDDLASLIQPSGLNENLSVMTSGPIPPNPAELLISNRLEKLFEYAKANYDYIIVDCAPVGLVTDSLIMARMADTTIYVTRANRTIKRHVDWINEINKSKKLPLVSIVFNGVDNQKSGYGYGGYGYGGYGGYGYGNEEKHKNKSYWHWSKDKSK